jgi:hypothetical protein
MNYGISPSFLFPLRVGFPVEGAGPVDDLLLPSPALASWTVEDTTWSRVRYGHHRARDRAVDDPPLAPASTLSSQ